MSHAGWIDIWKRVIELLAAEPIEVRIAVGLGVAFAMVMLLEGLRTSFLPAGRKKGQPAPRDAMTVAAPQKKSAAKSVAAAPVRIKMQAINPKVVKVHIKPYSPPRPQIRRVSQTQAPTPIVTEDGAPFSPLPPIIEQTQL